MGLIELPSIPKSNSIYIYYLDKKLRLLLEEIKVEYCVVYQPYKANLITKHSNKRLEVFSNKRKSTKRALLVSNYFMTKCAVNAIKSSQSLYVIDHLDYIRLKHTNTVIGTDINKLIQYIKC